MIFLSFLSRFERFFLANFLASFFISLGVSVAGSLGMSVSRAASAPRSRMACSLQSASMGVRPRFTWPFAWLIVARWVRKNRKQFFYYFIYFDRMVMPENNELTKLKMALVHLLLHLLLIKLTYFIQNIIYVTNL